MSIFFALLCTVIAGIINGSFALPTKHLKQWQFENIWFNYAFWGFLIFPWVSIFLLDGRVGSIYQQLTPGLVCLIFFGGLLFGIGQVCFAQALKMIGFGLGFVVNIGLSTCLGSLAPLIFLHSENLLTTFGLTTMLGAALIIIGLIISYYAGKNRDKQTQAQAQEEFSNKKLYKLGILLAVFAGLFSAGQNFVFAATQSMQTQAIAGGIHSLAASIIVWPPFLTCTFIPYIIYMLYLQKKNKSFANYRQNSVGSFSILVLLTVVMGAFWYGSLIFYSKASALLGHLGPVIAWPLFMVLIILTSSFWGWRHQEWADADQQTKSKARIGILFLIIAVVVLAFGSTLPN